MVSRSVVDLDTVLAARAKARAERIKLANAGSTAPMVHVMPAKPEYRKYLKHQPSGIGFLDEGGIDWPLDQFTKRRVRDGAVTIVKKEVKEEVKEEKKEPEKSRRHQDTSIT